MNPIVQWIINNLLSVKLGFGFVGMVIKFLEEGLDFDKIYDMGANLVTLFSLGMFIISYIIKDFEPLRAETSTDVLLVVLAFVVVMIGKQVNRKKT